MSERVEHLTAAQKADLETELAELEGPKRAEAVQAIKTARGFGDLSENFEYHAAKNEQGLLERRITILRSRLQSAVLIDEAAAAASEKVSVGSRVTIDRDDGETMDVEISSVGGVSPDSPLGKALIGTKVGDEVLVKAPGGTWRARGYLDRTLTAQASLLPSSLGSARTTSAGRGARAGTRPQARTDAARAGRALRPPPGSSACPPRGRTAPDAS